MLARLDGWLEGSRTSNAARLIRGQEYEQRSSATHGQSLLARNQPGRSTGSKASLIAHTGSRRRVRLTVTRSARTMLTVSADTTLSDPCVVGNFLGVRCTAKLARWASDDAPTPDRTSKAPGSKGAPPR